MRTIQLGNTDVSIPVIGQGTWKIGLEPEKRASELEALRQGIEHGATLIDTAEVYSEGESEKIVADAMKDCRDDIFLVTKIWPSNCTYDGIRRSLEGSLQRLGTSWVDLYLVHWPSADYTPAELMKAMKRVVADGEVRYIGVSNFSDTLLQEAADALGDIPLVCNQVKYHVNDRSIEHKVLPHCQQNNVTVMAYSPFGAGEFPAPGTAGRAVLDEIAEKHGRTPYQVVLNWLTQQRNVIAIPKTATPRYAVENAQAASFELTEDDIKTIDEAFPLTDEQFVVQTRS